ncbi:hypothetical protein HMPREF0555_0882 [Leuconostoc mesenteroides subsp. cremoris ATCC 19254]|uniref:Uncharacterized protein n=1 Tax=Leuconostoc mesenteroides subsp. cremoris ATCC 19254 TaxID=586220 RepID=C2KJR6_LEUMC|nr:hypothetical protein HMPREF0555_0882 [Leuconostoc mesenteroides subsp. cremoris ATCC 19254]
MRYIGVCLIKQLPIRMNKYDVAFDNSFIILNHFFSFFYLI